MQLLGSSKKDVDQNKDGENVPKLQFVEVVFYKHLRCYLLLYQINNLVN